MTDSTADDKAAPAPPEYAGGPITREEIREVLMDENYAAPGRVDWIRGVLTSIERNEPWGDEAERQRLVNEIKTIIAEFQSGQPLSDDHL
jgi:hypothetical protein